MGDLTPCNFCTLRRIKERAKKEGKKVTVLADAKWGMGGLNVYAHPKDVSVGKMPGGENGERSKFREAWFMELGKSCSC